MRSRRSRHWTGLHRSCPLLPGLPERATHDYPRHGTTTLFTALEVATGTVTDACYLRHRSDEFLRFLKLVAKAYPPDRRDQDLHRRLERPLPTVHLDQDRRPDPALRHRRSKNIDHTTLARACSWSAKGWLPTASDLP